MTFRSLLVLDVTVYTRTPTGAVDDYGLPVLSQTPTVYPRAGWMDEVETVEVIVGRDTVLSRFELTAGPEVVVGPFDQVRVSGFAPLFEVVGDPTQAMTPSGLHHLLLRLRSIEG